MNEKTLATVGGLPITETDLAALYATLGPRADAYKTPEGRAALLEELIGRKLFLLEAQKNLFEAEPEFREQMKRAKEQLLTEYAIRRALSSVRVTEEEVRKFYDDNQDKFNAGETVSASHILVDSEEKAGEIAAKIASGEKTFEEAAKEYSSCPSREAGGALGEFGRGQMVPEFEEAAFALEPGKISEPVKTQFGWHLIRVGAKNAEKPISYSEARETIFQKLTAEKQQAAYRSKINQLKIMFPVDKLSL